MRLYVTMLQKSNESGMKSSVLYAISGTIFRYFARFIIVYSEMFYLVTILLVGDFDRVTKCVDMNFVYFIAIQTIIVVYFIINIEDKKFVY